MAPYPWGSRLVGHPAFRWCCTCKRDVGAPCIPFNVLVAHRPSCEEYAPRNLDGTLMMAPPPGVVAASVKFHRWRLGRVGRQRGTLAGVLFRRPPSKRCVILSHHTAFQ